MEPLLVAGILLALLFNILTGLNHAANSVATLIATRGLSPRNAIALAAMANFAGPFLFTTAIAMTFATGIVEPSLLTEEIILAGIASAATLVLVATVSGLPISSSHALAGGLIGAALSLCGLEGLILPGPLLFLECAGIILAGAAAGAATGGMISWRAGFPVKLGGGAGALLGLSFAVTTAMLLGYLRISGILAIMVFIVVSPTLGFSSAFFFDVLISHLFRRSRIRTRRRIFQPLQVLASFFQALSNGAHEGQHAMGIIVALLMAGDLLEAFEVPGWVLIASASATAVGTCFGGWRVIERIARRITRIRPYQGFSASISGGLLISAMTLQGIPVSSTHAISGAIVGVGITRGRAAVQWETVRQILAAWIVTVPISIAFSWLVAGALFQWQV